MPRTKERHWLPHHLPQPPAPPPLPPPRVPCSENSDPRIPCTSFHGNSRPPSLHCSASFFPAPSPCSPILSPEPGLQGGLAHPLGGWPVSPSSEEGHADIYQSKHQTATPLPTHPHPASEPELQNDQAPGNHVQGTLESSGWIVRLRKQRREEIFFTVALWLREREASDLNWHTWTFSNGIPAPRLGNSPGSLEVPSRHVALCHRPCKICQLLTSLTSCLPTAPPWQCSCHISHLSVPFALSTYSCPRTFALPFPLPGMLCRYSHQASALASRSAERWLPTFQLSLSISTFFFLPSQQLLFSVPSFH